MKYVLVIIDGAADVPLKELGGKTPLEAANLPAMDSIAAAGVLGTVQTCPPALACGSDVAIMSVMGYDPARYYTGRAPIEATAQGIPVSDKDWVFRANIVTIRDNVMKDHSAANIGQEDANRIIGLLNKALADADIRFYPGVSYRNLLVAGRDISISTTPPHDILDKKIDSYLPQGSSAAFLRALMDKSRELLKKNRINKNATDIWFWGEGKKPRLSSFEKRFGVRGAAITAVDLVRGLAKLAGWDLIAVPGATAYFDTNYEGKGSYAIAALERYDLVCVHIEAPDEAGHKGDAKEKIRALENIDTHIVAPLLAELAAHYPEWRMLILPDHPTPCTIRTHTHEAVPFAIRGNDSRRTQKRTFSEKEAQMSGVYVSEGHLLMEKFITGDL
jgi:2,3-bisphosphoglycerate-independent phosphoglycerate mutase